MPGAVLGIWAGGQEILAACGVLNRATRVRVSTDADASGLNFVCRTHDDQPRHPLSFGALADGVPYVFLGGRITPRVE